MVGPAFQLSSKIPDMRLQAWAAALLIGKLVLRSQLICLASVSGFRSKSCHR